MVYIDCYFIHTALIAAFFRISDDVTQRYGKLNGNNSENNAVYLKRNQTLHDYTPKNSNVTTIHINTAEDLQKYIQDKMK